MDKKSIHLKKSFTYILYFYLPIFLLVFTYVSWRHNIHLLIACSIVLFGNLFIAIFTQVSNYIIEKYSIEGRTRDFLYHNFTDCFYRCGAGILEMVLYTVSFATNLESLVAGYLLLKTVSVWQDNFSNKKEGLHTAILRIAIVLSLLISLSASYYLKKYINNY